MKSEVMVKVSEGNGQVARACEDGGFEVQTWIPGGVAGDHALTLALRHLSQKQRLFAVIVNFQEGILDELVDSRVSLCQRVVGLAVSRRFPLLV